MCQKWFEKFRAGDFSLDDAPHLGRPVEVGSDQIETLIENNQYSTTWEIATILKISKSIKLLVKMKNVSFILQGKKTIQTFWPTQYNWFITERNRIHYLCNKDIWASSTHVIHYEVRFIRCDFWSQNYHIEKSQDEFIYL